MLDFVNIQYFVEIVPTEIMGFTGLKTTYQYSVKEHMRPIDHNKGSHGTPGIYFKYDLSALKVEVTKDRFVHCKCTLAYIYSLKKSKELSFLSS